MLLVIRMFFIIISSYYLSDMLYKSQLKSTGELIITFVYLLVLFSVVSYIHIKFIKNRLTNMKRSNFISALSALIVTVLLLALFGSHFVYPYKQSSVTIVATSEKDNVAKAAEVWISSVSIDGEAVGLTSVPLPDGWVLKNGSVMCTANRPMTLTLNFKAAKQIEITFIKHPWSGIVTMRDGNSTTSINLYAPDEGKYVYSVKSNFSNQITLIMLVDYSMAFIFLYSALYILIGGLLLYIVAKRSNSASHRI